MRPLLSWSLLLAAITLAGSTYAMADEGASHDGVVVSASAGKLTMKDDSGREHSHDVGPMAKITVNGKPGKLEDLKAGVRIHVMTDEKRNVVSISTIDSEK